MGKSVFVDMDIVFFLQNTINIFYFLYYDYWDLSLSSGQALRSGTLPLDIHFYRVAYEL